MGFGEERVTGGTTGGRSDGRCNGGSAGCSGATQQHLSAYQLAAAHGRHTAALLAAGASCEQAGASADEASDGCGSNGGTQPFIFTRRGHGWGQPWGSCTWCGWATNATTNTKGQQHANRRFGGRGQPATLMERYRRGRQKEGHRRSKFTILPGRVSHTGCWWRRQWLGDRQGVGRRRKQGGRQQRVTVWARAKSKAHECG